MSLKRSWVRLYLNQKVQGYKQQDKKAGIHYNNKDYIDPECIGVRYGRVEAVYHLPKNFLQVAQIFLEQSKGNEGHTMH